MPTTAAAATLLQTITPPGQCSSFAHALAAANPAHGTLTRSADGTHLVFACMNASNLIANSNTVPNVGGGPTGWLIGQLYPTGLINLFDSPVFPGNDAYQVVGLSAFNSSAYCASGRHAREHASRYCEGAVRLCTTRPPPPPGPA